MVLAIDVRIAEFGVNQGEGAQKRPGGDEDARDAHDAAARASVTERNSGRPGGRPDVGTEWREYVLIEKRRKRVVKV